MISPFDSYKTEIEELFEKYQVAYRLVHFKDKGHWNFHPITSEANRQALQNDLSIVEEAGYKGATEYFINASKAIKDQKFKLSIRESNSATEAIARDMTGKKALGDALKKLKNIRPDIDERIIKHIEKITVFDHVFRHGKEPKPDDILVDQDLSILMFSVHAAISGYLATKAKKKSG